MAKKLDEPESVRTVKKGKKAKKREAKAKSGKGQPRSSRLAQLRARTTAVVLGAGLAIGAAVGTVLGRRR
jgi:hypothetical protein